jgi:serine/threonine protein kinase
LSNLPKSDQIIALHEVIKTTNHFYLFVDYCNGGNLETLLENRLMLKESEVQVIF